MKIIVTGASGNYGGAAVRKLLDRVPAEDFILISRTPAKLAEYAQRGASVRFGDYDDPASLDAAFAGGERLLLISGTRIGARIAQHKAAVDAAARAGVRQLAYTSMVGASADNPAIVGQEHWATEEHIKASGIEWTLLRDQHYADNMVVFMGANAIRSGIWQTATGSGLEAFVWRDDCVDCAVEVLASGAHAGKTYNITGPELLTLRDLAAMVAEISGRPFEIVDTDDEGMYAMFQTMGIPRTADPAAPDGPGGSDAMVTFEQAIREGWLTVISDDVEALTGRKPRSVRQLIEANRELLANA